MASVIHENAEAETKDKSTQSSEIIRKIAKDVSLLKLKNTKSLSCLFLIAENSKTNSQTNPVCVSFTGFGQLYYNFMENKCIHVKGSQFEDISHLSHDLMTCDDHEVTMNQQFSDEICDIMKSDILNLEECKLLESDTQGTYLSHKDVEVSMSVDVPILENTEGPIIKEENSLGGIFVHEYDNIHTNLMEVPSTFDKWSIADAPPLDDKNSSVMLNDGDTADEHDSHITKEKEDGDESSKCKTCSKEFLTKSSLRIHEKMHERRQCEVCSNLFRNEHYLKEHVKLYHEGMTHKCQECEAHFDHYDDFCEHYLSRHSMQKSDNLISGYKCIHCSKLMKTKTLIKSHMNVHHGKVYKCQYCPDSFSTLAFTIKHEKKHTDISLQCPECSQQFTSCDALKAHRSAHNPDSGNIKKHLDDLRNDNALSSGTIIPMTISDGKHTTLAPFRCSVCGKRFDKLKNFKSHSMLHSNKKVFQCPHCQKQHATYEAMLIHEIMHSTQVFTCKLCDLHFTRRKSYDKHKKMHVKGRLKCKICQAVFANKHLFKHHVSQHMHRKCDECGEYFKSDKHIEQHKDLYHTSPGKQNIRCDDCDMEFSSQDLYLKHQVHMHSPTLVNDTVAYKCPFCDKTRGRKSHLIFHIKYVHEGKVYFCIHCNRTFASLSTFRQHKANHKNSSLQCHVCKKLCISQFQLNIHKITHIEKVSCTHCKLAFDTQLSLDKHMKVHNVSVVAGSSRKQEVSFNTECRGDKISNSPPPGTCNMCGVNCIDEHNLVVHQMRKHFTKKVSCKKCGKCFKNSQILNRHDLRVHSGAKFYQCEICGVSFKNRNNLIYHRQRAHEPDYVPVVRSFSCDQCTKVYKSKQSLRTHKMDHTKERPFMCTKCGKTFKTKYNLRVHEETHLGLKPFACKICGKKFTQERRLNTHQIVHTGIKPYSCDICCKRFTRTEYLNQHNKRYHS